MPPDVLFDNTHPLTRRMWHAVALAEEVGAEPVQVWVGGEPWLLVRVDGKIVAFFDQCPHRLAPMTAGRIVDAEDGSPRLQCGYHGWRYEMGGQCDLIPALGKSERISKRARLRAPHAVAERYGLVWLAPEEPRDELPAFPEWTDDGMTTARSEVVRTAVGAGQLVDNFLDAAHFPYVHAGTFGTDDAVLDGVVDRVGPRVVASFTTPYRENDVVREHTVTKTVGPALSVHLRLAIDDGPTMGILLACLPEKAGSTRVFKLLARDDLGSPADVEEFVKSEDVILTEDLTILERYAHSWISLDPRAEMHTRSDRLSLAWRNLLAEATSEVAP